MREFKAGDRVKFTGASGTAFTKGKTYIVKEYPNRWGHVGVTEDDGGSSINGFHPDYWELVGESTDFKVGDMVKVVGNGGMSKDGRPINHHLDLGETCEVLSIDTNLFVRGSVSQFVSVEDVELVDLPVEANPELPSKPLIKREVVFYYGEEVSHKCNLRHGLEVYETEQGVLVVYNSKTGEVEGEIPL